MAQVSPGGELEPIGGGVSGNVPGDVVTSGVKYRKSIAGPESELRLKKELVPEVSDGLRGLRVLGAVSQDWPGLTGSCEVSSRGLHPGQTGQHTIGGLQRCSIVLQSNLAPGTGGNLQRYEFRAQ